MLGCNGANTLMESVSRCNSEKSPQANKDRYQSLVGKLIYLTHTRPDIWFVVSMESCYMTSHTKAHMKVMIRNLQYLKGTPDRGLHFKKNPNSENWSKTHWAGCILDRKSIIYYFSFVWGNIVTWRSKKQSVVARSSEEAEFKAMTRGICEWIWMKKILD